MPVVIMNEDIDSVARRRAEYTEAICIFVADRRSADSLKAREIGQLGKGRLAALTRSSILAMRDYYIANKNADVGPGILLLLHAYSDNDRGTCFLSVDRMAKLLRRSITAVSAAIARLENIDLVTVERVPGRSSLYVVRAPKLLASAGQITWLLDALAPMEPPRKHGVRRDDPVSDSHQGGSGAVPNTPTAALPSVDNYPQVGKATAPKAACPDSPTNSPMKEEEGQGDSIHHMVKRREQDS
jgi:hypothetical protein